MDRSQFQGESPASIGAELGANALGFLGSIGLRRYQLDTMGRAQSLISKDTGLIKDANDLKASQEEINSIINEMQNLYAFTGQLDMEQFQMLNNKKAILDSMSFDEDGNQVVTDEYGNKKDISEIEFGLKNTFGEERTAETDSNINKKIDEYLEYYKDKDEAQIQKDLDTIVDNAEIDNKQVSDYYKRNIDKRIKRNNFVKSMKKVNEKLDKNSLSEKELYELRKEFKKCESLYAYATVEDRVEFDKMEYRYKALKEKK